MTFDRQFIKSGLLVWPALLVAAVANGLLREGVVAPLIGAAASHVVGLVTGLALVALITFLFLKWVGARRPEATLWLLGAVWTVLAIVFEFVFFGLLLGVPVADLLAEYNVLDGYVWPLFLLGLLVAPWIIARWLTSNGDEAGHRDMRRSV